MILEKVYRGQYGTVDLKSRDYVYTFSDTPEVAKAHAKYARNLHDIAAELFVCEYALEIKNPFHARRDDMFIEVGEIRKKMGDSIAEECLCNFEDSIKGTNAWQYSLAAKYARPSYVPNKQADKLIINVSCLLKDLHFILDMKAAGFDGAIYGANFGFALGTVEYAVFSEAQAKRLRQL